jgi:competence protein ComEA
MLAWPRSAQLATGFALGVATTLVMVRCYGYSPWSTRPSALTQGSLTAYRVDLNRAERAELLQLPGVGESLAERIEDYRREHGHFQTVNDLVKVHGIGPSTFRRLRPLICVEGEDAEPDEIPARGPSKGPKSPARPVSEQRKQNGKAASLIAPIDINQASAAELQRLPGIGPTMSQRIVAERSKRPFQAVDELRRVPGIGPKKLETLRPYVIVHNTSLRVATADQDEALDGQR